MPLRSIETKEQRQQRLLQSKQARQAREQEIKQGLSSLPGQAAWMAGLMLPTSGGTDYFGMYPEMPTGEGITGKTMPSFAENIRNKRYLDAAYQGLGLTGDLALAAGAVYPPALALGAGMKVASGMGKAAKAAKADDLLEWQKPLTEQQPAVQEKIKNLIGEDFFNKAAADGLTGEDVYRNFEEVMLNDDLAQYGLEFLKPKLSTEKLGPGAYFNEAGIKGIVYGPESVEVFDPLKYKKVESGAKLPESLQPPKKPIGLTNKKITARQLISGRIDPDFYAKDELMEAAGSILVKKKPHKYSTSAREVQKLAPWVYQKRGTKRDGVLGLKDYDEIIELFHEQDPTWAEQLDEAYKVRLDVDRPGLTPEQLINKWIRNDDLIPSQVDEVFEYNRTLEYQDEVIETLESKGYNPEGMTEDELSSVLEKINSDPESVEVDVFVDVEEDALPPWDITEVDKADWFNRGGPVTRPLYSDKRYLL